MRCAEKHVQAIKIITLGCKCVLSDQSSAFGLQATQKCLSIGTLKTINFSFGTDGKLMVLRCLNIFGHLKPLIFRLGQMKN